jgi:hypothetical protein
MAKDSMEKAKQGKSGSKTRGSYHNNELSKIESGLKMIQNVSLLQI